MANTSDQRTFLPIKTKREHIKILIAVLTRRDPAGVGQQAPLFDSARYRVGLEAQVNDSWGIIAGKWWVIPVNRRRFQPYPLS